MFKIYAPASVCLSLLLIPSIAKSQVNRQEPSAQTLFKTVINLPPDLHIGDFGSIGSSTQLNLMDGGKIGLAFEANSGSEVNIRGGTVGSAFQANSNSKVNINGGTVGSLFQANSGSEVNITAGIVGGLFHANLGSKVNIRGGIVGKFFAETGSMVNIRGGTLSSNLVVDSGSVVNLFGSDFFLGGVPLENLVPGKTFAITERDVMLSGLLADGTSFNFNLNGMKNSQKDYFDAGAALTVMLVPEPCSLLLCMLSMVGVMIGRRG